MDSEELFSFEKLDAYKHARALVRSVYKKVAKLPAEERYALCDQLRRASVSITSNIAEGMSRISSKEQVHFLEISYSSMMEVLSQLQLAVDLGYISQEDLDEERKHIKTTSKLIIALHHSIKKRINKSPLNP